MLCHSLTREIEARFCLDPRFQHNAKSIDEFKGGISGRDRKNCARCAILEIMGRSHSVSEGNVGRIQDTTNIVSSSPLSCLPLPTAKYVVQLNYDI